MTDEARQSDAADSPTGAAAASGSATPGPSSDRLKIVPIAAEAAQVLLALNNAHALQTSPLTRASWRHLVEIAFHAVMLEDASGCLIALDQDAPYPNPNHGWFRARYDRFVYVDRIIVDAAAQRCGRGRRLYEHLFARSRAAGQARVGCEVNIDPPNPRSDRFHQGLGFVEIGNAKLPSNAKTVRYLEKRL